MRKFFIASLMCFTLLTPSILNGQNDEKKKEETKKEKKDCKDDSCKKPKK